MSYKKVLGNKIKKWRVNNSIINNKEDKENLKLIFI